MCPEDRHAARDICRCVLALFVPVSRRPDITEDLVEFEMMTGRGQESNPRAGQDNRARLSRWHGAARSANVNGGHNLMGRATVRAIAIKLGNAIAARYWPYSPEQCQSDLPGTIGLTPALFARDQ